MAKADIESIAAAFMVDSVRSNEAGQTGFVFAIDDYTGSPVVRVWEPIICGDRVVDAVKIHDLGIWLGDIAVLSGLDVPVDDILDLSDAIGRQARLRQFEEGMGAVDYV